MSYSIEENRPLDALIKRFKELAPVTSYMLSDEQIMQLADLLPPETFEVTFHFRMDDTFQITTRSHFVGDIQRVLDVVK